MSKISLLEMTDLEFQDEILSKLYKGPQTIAKLKKCFPIEESRVNGILRDMETYRLIEMSPKHSQVSGVNIRISVAGWSVIQDYGSYLEYKKHLDQENSTELKKTFIDLTRLQELSQTKNSDFDLTRLIRLCAELNDNFFRENFLSVAVIGRTITNHIPPIFGFGTFTEVVNNYGGSSFKKSMNHLNGSLKNIADGILHDTIRKKESLPNSTQVNFSQDLDVLLAEIVRKLNEK